LTQIRAKVGEEAFWGALRKLLADHALGSVDSESFVRNFAPALDEATIQKVLGSLDAKVGPQITVMEAPSGVDTTLTISIADPSGNLITAIGMTVVDARGQATEHQLTPDAPLTVTVPVGGYIAPDEEDIHPLEALRGYFGGSSDHATPLTVPTAPAALAAFESRSAAHQERALGYGLPISDPGALAAFVAQLDSPLARTTTATSACENIQYPAPGSDPSAWANALAPILQHPAELAFNLGYGSCGVDLATRTFGAEFASLSSSIGPAAAARVAYVASFDYGPAQSFGVLSRLATAAPSLQLREQAIERLSLQAQGLLYTRVPAADVPIWQAFFRDRLLETTSANHFNSVWSGARGLADQGALPLAAQALHRIDLTAKTQRQVICDAAKIAKAPSDAWTAFQKAAEPWDSLSSMARAALADFTSCTHPGL
jgi:hypothetical protein